MTVSFLAKAEVDKIEKPINNTVVVVTKAFPTVSKL